jgi:phage terminase large subunit-like protein
MSCAYSAPLLAEHWAEVLAALTPAERVVLPHALQLWLRPEQQIDLGGWRVHGTIAGRGWGKTHGYASLINRLVAGNVRNVGLMGPTEKVTAEVQVQALIETAPPWQRPAFFKDHVAWPNGANALLFSAEAPEKTRGANLEVSWCTELVAWPRSTARAAWDNLALATRIGVELMCFDTTSKGRNPLVLARVEDSEADPARYPIQHGTTYDNPLLSPEFLRAVEAMYPEGSRQFQEEVLGRVFREASLALWDQAWIDAGRREIAPAPLDLVILALDPARSERADADEFGLVCAGRQGREIYILEDHSGHLTAEHAANVIVDRCQLDAAGFVWETNNVGKAIRELISVIARQRGLVLYDVPAGKPFPRRQPGRIYVREVHTARSKESRADAPARLYADGRVHHVGDLSKLEEELTTWEPGEGKSPNRLDALVYVVAELGEVALDKVRSPTADAGGAARAQELLRAGLHRIGRGRRI